MNVIETIRAMMAQSKMSTRRLSVALNREKSYVSSTLYKGRIPSVRLFARMADICGYDTLVRRREDGTEILLDTDDE